MVFCKENKTKFQPQSFPLNNFDSFLFSALEAAVALGGEGLIPFYGLLEGGRDGELFAELEDYFYYAQIRRLVTFCFFSLVTSNAVFSECTFRSRKDVENLFTRKTFILLKNL